MFVPFDAPQKEVEFKKVEITLNDCLACSGCVTSAETVLIAQQSYLELYKVLEENKKQAEVTRTGQWLCINFCIILHVHYWYITFFLSLLFLACYKYQL